MSASIAVVALLMASQATALPSLWNDRHQGCTLPTMGYKGHLAPINDAGLTFSLTDSNGTAVTSFTPQTPYDLKVSYSAEVHIWVGTTDGAFATSTDLLGCNGLSAYMGGMPTATSFSVIWIAPNTCANATVFANAAKSPSDNFRQAKLTVPCVPSPTTPGTPPSTTPTSPSTPTMTPPTATAPPPPSLTGGAASIAVSAVAIVVALLALLT